jgi:hypothetical protein
VTAAEAKAVADLEKTKSLAAEFEALGGGALTMALAQEAEPGDPLRKCMLARERLRVSEAHSMYRAEILTAHTGTSAEAAEASAEAAEAAAAEAAAAKAAAAVNAAVAAETAAAAGGGRRESRRRCAWCASGLGARAAGRAWRRRGRRGRGRERESRAARVLCWGPRGIEISRRVAQQRGSKRGSPGREIDTDQILKIT